MIYIKRRRGKWHWAWIPSKWPCRIGLHFMHYSIQMDGYVCPCGRQHLWDEEMSRNA